MVFSRVFSAQPHMLAGHIVSVETDISRGLHAFSIVGLPDKAVEEAKDRVSSAIKNSGFESPKSKNQKTIISLAPAELKKEGSYFDLAISLGYLLSSGDISFDPEGKIFIGELSLNGEIKSLHGVLPLVQAAQKAGFQEMFVPKQNAREAALVRGITIFPIETLGQVIAHIESSDKEEEKHLKIERAPETPLHDTETPIFSHNFADIRGQETAKRGLEIAAAGGHNAAMYGPPGTGKTMLARAFASLLPQMSLDETLEVTGIHSISGTLGEGTLITEPPFRSPHHTSSYVSVIGGGANPRPGEVTLAHRGVLFLDEFPEFDKRVLESLRQPLEDRFVSIARARGRAVFPTHFILIAAMNPPEKRATAIEIERYKRKISGPIMDRIDIWLPVEHITYESLSENAPRGEDSTKIAKRVLLARKRAEERLAEWGSPATTNGGMSVRDLEKIPLDDKTRALLNTSAERMQISPRVYHRIIKLAQTICDLDPTAEKIEEKHILEALQYRPRMTT